MEWQLRVRFWVCKFNILFSVAGEGGEILQCKGRVVPAAAAQLPILVIWLPPAKFPFEQLESVRVLITSPGAVKLCRKESQNPNQPSLKH